MAERAGVVEARSVPQLRGFASTDKSNDWRRGRTGSAAVHEPELRYTTGDLLRLKPVSRIAPPADYAIRRATAGDLDALVALEQAAFTTDHLSRRQYTKHLRSDSARVFVAMDEGGLLGKALVFFHKGSDIARLYSIAVADRARGRGIAKALLAKVEQAARSHGCRRMRLEVSQSNPSAIALYERLGYHRFAEHREYYENGEHAWRYEKRLID